MQQGVTLSASSSSSFSLQTEKSL